MVAPFFGQYPDGDLAYTHTASARFLRRAAPVEQPGVARTQTETWMVDVAGAGWSAPRHVAELSSPADESVADLAAHDGTLYFGSCRDGGLAWRDCDIYRSRLHNDGHPDQPVNAARP